MSTLPSLSTLLLASALATLAAALVLTAAAAAAGSLRRLAVAEGTADVDTPPGASAAPRIAHAGAFAALVLLVAALVSRALATGHAPWSNLHEFSAAFAAGVLATYLALERRAPIRGLAPIVGLVAAALMLVALGLDDRIDPLVPALQQPVLLTIHVGAAVLAYAFAAMAFAAAVAELVHRHARGSAWLLPSPELARSIAHRSVLLGFPVLTAAIALGAIWANLAWRSFWSNDPKELAAAATWLVFGGYLHVAGRRDRWSATAPWLIVLGFAGVLFTYLGAGLLFIGEHSYAAP